MPGWVYLDSFVFVVVGVCVCVCVCERERERERVRACACVCVCARASACVYVCRFVLFVIDPSASSAHQFTLNLSQLHFRAIYHQFTMLRSNLPSQYCVLPSTFPSNRSSIFHVCIL